MTDDIKGWLPAVFLWLGWTGMLTTMLSAESPTGMVSLRSLTSKQIHVEVVSESEADKREMVLHWRDREARFREDEASYRLNGIKVDLPGRIVWDPDRNSLVLAADWYEWYVQPLLQTPVMIQDDTKQSPLLFLDPGHGGSQRGGRGLEIGLVEKELTLRVAMLLKELMEKQGWQVVLSRETDQVLALQERSRLANEAGANLFLSIHFNAAANRQARGIEMFTLRPEGEVKAGASTPTAMPGNRKNADNLILAWFLQQSLIQKTGWLDRGVRRGNFVVLKDLTMPGVLAELGFLTHVEEEALIARPETLQQLAEGLSEGIVAWWNGIAKWRIFRRGYGAPEQ